MRDLKNTKTIMPPQSFYSLSATLINGTIVDFETLRGKYVLIVNTASNCGYTAQYDELEALYQLHPEKLVILAFPANNFGGQEPGSNEQIAEFCRVNFGVSFPVFKKDSVKGANIQPVFDWLSNATKNGWQEQQPNWNFCKYLVNKEGVLTSFFPSAVSPLGEAVSNALL